MNEQQIATLKEIGNEWTSPDGNKHRIYFNDLPAWYGLKTWRYNSGNISGATLDGEKISNSEARRIIGRMMDAKLYYDLSDDKFHGKGFNDEYDDFEECVKAIRARVSELVAFAADKGTWRFTAIRARVSELVAQTEVVNA